jgi:hypothetical protein
MLQFFELMRAPVRTFFPIPRMGMCLMACLLVLLWTDRASAYIGPGADLQLVGYFSGLIAWVLIAFASVLLWPVYKLIRWIRGRKENSPSPDTVALTSAAPDQQSASFNATQADSTLAPVQSADSREGLRDRGQAES